MFKALETFIPYVKLFQRFSLLLPNMPPVPLGPQHLSQNALHPPPFVPPEVLKDVYPDLCDHFETVLHTSYPKLNRQLKMYEESAEFMVRRSLFCPGFRLFSTFIQVSLHGYAELIAVTSEIYMGYQNVVSKIRQTHPDANDHTANVTKLLAMCSEMQGHRKRARLAAEKASLVAMEKNREEKDLAKEAAREEKRVSRQYFYQCPAYFQLLAPQETQEELSPRSPYFRRRRRFCP